MTAFLKKHWWWMLALALLVLWVFEWPHAGGSLGDRIKKWLQDKLGNVFTGFVEVCAVVVIATVVVFLIVGEAVVWLIVAVAGLLAFAAWKLFGWFKGLLGGGSAPAPAPSTPIVATAVSYWNDDGSINILALPAGSVIDPNTGSATLPDGTVIQPQGGPG